MENKMVAVASIALDRPDNRRGWIRVGETSEGWEVDCLTPENDVEPAALQAFETREQAMDAIDASWGRGPWDLQWVD
jgi:hypothetical protein